MEAITGHPANIYAAILLYEQGTCIRCILRFFRVQGLDNYRDKSKYIPLLGLLSDKSGRTDSLLLTYNVLHMIRNNPKPENTSIAPQTQGTSSVASSEVPLCRLCLGLLQHCDNKEYVYKIAQQIRQSKFEFEKFKFLIKVPNSVLLRFAQAVEFVKEKLVQQNQGDIKGTNIINKWRDYHLEIKTVMKWILAPLLSQQLNSQSTIEDGNLQINLNFDNAQDDNQCFNKFYQILRGMAAERLEKKLGKVQKKMKIDKLENLQRQVELIEPSAANLNKILDIDSEYSFKTILQGQFPPQPRKECAFKLDIRSNSIYLFGYYIKYSRYLSQTPFALTGVQIESSIQEELQKVLLKYFYPPELCKSDQVKFHSGGREDIDVRMLLSGRPFAIEFCSPRFNRIQNTEGYQPELQKQINNSPFIKVRGLTFTDDKCLEVLKKSEIEKIKAYSCFVQFEKPYTQKDVDILNSVAELELHQKTPLRVLHRRTLMVRNKMIHRLKAFPIDSHTMLLNVLASAGTYIKEFVHGDLERTTPNIGSLVSNQADIFQLDVLKLYEKLDEEAVQDFLTLKVGLSDL